MKISERIELTIDRWSEKWKDKLRGWFLRALSEGAKRLLDDLEIPLATEAKSQLEEIRDIPELPATTKALIDKALKPKSFAMAIILIPLIISVVMAPIMAALDGIITPIRFAMNKSVKPFRLDPGTITRIWLRDKPKYEELWDDLKDLGFSKERIDVYKELSKYLPAPTEIMTWAAREVFEPKLREKYQLDKFLPPDFLIWAEKVGITGEVAKNYWAAHWVLPSLTSIIELWRRKIIGKEDVDAFWTELDMVPWVRENLFKLFRTIPTRVDVRRFWDMRTIDEKRLRDIYQAQGYWEEDLEDYVLWTKVYVAFPDLIARWKNGWITEDDIRSELTALGMPADRVAEMIETKIKPVAPARVEGERTATATEIMKAVKKEYITWAEGVERLGRMGYSPSEAEFKLDVYIGVAEGSPESYIEFVDLTERYRQAMGLEAKLVPPELLEAGKALAEARKAEAEAREKELKDEKLAPYLKAINDAEYRYRQLLVAWQAK